MNKDDGHKDGGHQASKTAFWALALTAIGVGIVAIDPEMEEEISLNIEPDQVQASGAMAGEPSAIGSVASGGADRLGGVQVPAAVASAPAQIPDGAWPTIHEQIREAQYFFTPSTTLPGGQSGYRAPNPAHRMSVAIGGGALTLNPEPTGSVDGGPGWTLQMNLVGADKGATASAERGRVEVVHPSLGLSEWYRNDRGGLEQGFTVERPADEIRVSLDVMTELSAVGDAPHRGDDLVLVDALGVEQLRYHKLEVFDASGRELPARMEMAEGGGEGAFRLDLIADARGAVFPVTVDPLFTRREITISGGDGAEQDQNGFAVEVNQSFLVIGARNHDSFAGAVYVFVRNADGSYSFLQKLQPADSAPNQRFGSSLELSFEQLLVGAPEDPPPVATGPGAVYVFALTDALVWAERQKLTALVGTTGDAFGLSATGDGDTIVVGVPRDDVGGADNRGTAVVFTRPVESSPFTQQLTIQGSADGEQSLFGIAVKLIGDRLLVGAPGTAGREGRVYQFGRDVDAAGAWGQEEILLASPPTALEDFGWAVDAVETGDTSVLVAIGVPGRDSGRGAVQSFYLPPADCAVCGIRVPQPFSLHDGEPNDFFGSSVAVTNDFIAVGVPGRGVGGADNRGAVVLYSRFGSLFYREAERISSLGGNVGDLYGFSVALDGGILAVGSPRYDYSTETDRGAVFVNAIDGGSWAQCLGSLGGSPAEAGDEVGLSIAVDQEFMVVGAPGAQTGGVAAGAAYLFTRRGGGGNQWLLLKRLEAATPAAGDRFGEAVDIDGDTIVIGAPGRDGVGGGDSGEVYVFLRNAFGTPDLWDLHRILDADSPQAGAGFGSAVSICCDIICVGAPLEDTPNLDQGAAYAFHRNQPGNDTWGQVGRMTGSLGASGDGFGAAVSCSSDAVSVGAPWHNVGTVSNAGAVYTFVRNSPEAELWGEFARTLPPGDPLADGEFGRSVSLDGSTLAVGMRRGVSLFERNAGGADSLGEVVSIGGGHDDFGSKVALCGDKLAILGSDRNGSAAIFVHRRNIGGADTWGEAAKVTSSRGEPMGAGGGLGFDGEFVAAQLVFGPSGSTRVAVFHHQNASYSVPAHAITAGAHSQALARFGSAVDLTDEFLIVGAPLENVGQGAAYVFGRNTDGADRWGRLAKLTDPTALLGDGFGSAVAIDDGRALVGNPGADGAGSSRGHVLEFQRNEGAVDGWGRTAFLTPSFPGDGAEFGYAVDLEGDTAIIGAPGALGAGRAYIFDYATQLTGMFGVGTLGGDSFGAAVSLSDDTAIVGAPGMNSDAGGAFIFERNQSGKDAWGQVAQLAMSAAADDRAGWSVAIDGEVAAVGAPGSTGAVADSGVVHVFRRNLGAADGWARLKTLSSGVAGDAGQFGAAVALRGHRLAVGAPGGSSGAAYIYERDLHGQHEWGLMERLVHLDYDSDGSSGSGGPPAPLGIVVRHVGRVGQSIAISDSFVAVGASESNTGTFTGDGFSSTWDMAGSVYVFRPLSHFRNWAYAELRPFDNNEEFQDLMSSFETYRDLDLDGDGLTLFMEYLMGLDPEVFDSGAAATRFYATSSTLWLRFRRAKYAPDGRLVVKWSRDLRTWAGDGEMHATEGIARDISEEIISDFGDSVLVEARISVLPGETKLFLRTEAERITAF